MAYRTTFDTETTGYLHRACRDFDTNLSANCSVKDENLESRSSTNGFQIDQPGSHLIVCSEGNPPGAVKVLPKLSIEPVFGKEVSEWREQLKEGW